ncbi:hypothetical protein A3Q56_01535 [Intoshia linei]|uniref:SRCR domain-containing protein n=1 Tax=Intoshia linei TaxID=1819745 RepID=A0A177B8S1_9BILA|nr:hypothetical protein A3Q56_01535 [Intoshia linei]
MSFASKLVIIISFVSTTCKLVLHQDQFNQSYTHNNDIIEKFSIRLVGSEISGIGNVQIRKNHDEWKWVCDDGWNKKSADIVCSMMGYSGSLTPTNSTYFDVSENDAITDFGLDDIYCNGTEKNILLCYHKGWNSHDCNMNEIAGVYCNVNNEKLTNLPSNEYLQNIFDDNFTQKQNIYFDEVKLQIKAIKLNKNSENIGIVEVELNNGKTGIICGDEWTMNEANLVCRYLNMGMAGKILRGITYIENCFIGNALIILL